MRGSHGEPAGFLLFRITYLFTLFLFVLVLIIPARFFDALLKMLNRKFRMKIVPGEAFFNETRSSLRGEGGFTIRSQVVTLREKNLQILTGGFWFRKREISSCWKIPCIVDAISSTPRGKKIIFPLLFRIGERIIKSMSPCRREQRNCLCLRAIPGDGAPAPGREKSFLYPVLSVIPFLFLSRIRSSRRKSSFSTIRLTVNGITA